MRDPLIKRLPRELKSEFGKQLSIFLFFVMIIGAASGYIVSGGSLIKEYNDSFTKYNIEDGNFELMTEASSDVIKDIEEAGGISVYENFYKDEETKSFDSTLRIYGRRDEIDKVCLLTGAMPSADDEIGIDRLYAKNHKLDIGSTITLDEDVLKVSGIVAFSDYSTLYENPSDLMFDNDKFGVGVMTKAGFEGIRDNHLHYSYSWLYDHKPGDDNEAKELGDELMKTISERAMLTNYIPEYVNQAIIFAGNDMGDDKVAMEVFLYITVIILAFITAITTDSTIIAEAGVIGTLRASGYTRGELLRHYLILPLITLLSASVVGNVLGYTFFEKYMAAAYLNSYSLTTYEVIFSFEAMLKTTLIPLAIMLVINIFTLTSKLKLSPLRFIRHDISKRGKKKAFRLNTKIPIMTRFRLRIIFQNMPNYVTIVIGSFLANSILMFGMVFTPMLENFQDNVKDNMLANNVYVLKMPAETDAEGAEKAAMLSLSTLGDKAKPEDITVYGIEEDSRYVSFDHGAEGVYISTAYSNKYDIFKGDNITLKEKYSDKEYSFKVSGLYSYPATLAVFMDADKFNEAFDTEEGYFNAYLSNAEITDIDDRLIATHINEDDLTKTSRQMIRSMGSIMKVFLVFGIIMFVLVIYLLAKIIIEKNAQSISMVKILGYTKGEINGLYVHSTTIIAVASILLTIPAVNVLLKVIFKIVFLNYSGYFAYDVSPLVLVKSGLIGVVSYLFVALILTAKVKKVDLSEALKNVE